MVRRGFSSPSSVNELLTIFGGRDAWNKRKGLNQMEAERLYVEALIKVRFPSFSSDLLEHYSLSSL